MEHTIQSHCLLICLLQEESIPYDALFFWVLLVPAAVLYWNLKHVPV
jgi:hypothetical protein